MREHTRRKTHRAIGVAAMSAVSLLTAGVPLALIAIALVSPIAGGSAALTGVSIAGLVAAVTGVLVLAAGAPTREILWQRLTFANGVAGAILPLLGAVASYTAFDVARGDVRSAAELAADTLSGVAVFLTGRLAADGSIRFALVIYGGVALGYASLIAGIVLAHGPLWPRSVERSAAGRSAAGYMAALALIVPTAGLAAIIIVGTPVAAISSSIAGYIANAAPSPAHFWLATMPAAAALALAVIVYAPGTRTGWIRLTLLLGLGGAILPLVGLLGTGMMRLLGGGIEESASDALHRLGGILGDTLLHRGTAPEIYVDLVYIGVFAGYLCLMGAVALLGRRPDAARPAAGGEVDPPIAAEPDAEPDVAPPPDGTQGIAGRLLAIAAMGQVGFVLGWIAAIMAIARAVLGPAWLGDLSEGGASVALVGWAGLIVAGGALIAVALTAPTQRTALARLAAFDAAIALLLPLVAYGLYQGYVDTFLAASAEGVLDRDVIHIADMGAGPFVILYALGGIVAGAIFIGLARKLRDRAAAPITGADPI